MAEDDESVDGSYLTPTRGWRVYGPSSRTMAKMMRQQTHSQLLQKAASLTPDYGKVIEGIQKYKVDPVTAKWFENEANSKMQGYINKFQENPFYAFSREGRETVTSLQRLANDPRLQYAETAYDMSKKEYEKHGEELQTINYDGGNVMVYDSETGTSKKMNAFNIDPTKHIPLTGEQEFQVLTMQKGFKDREQPFKVTVSKVSELRNRLHTEFNDSGYVKIKDDIRDMATKTNQPQIKSKFESLVNTLNLSEQDKNTINGQYLAYAVANGQKPTAQGARDYMIKYLADIADYKTYSETTTGDGSGEGSESDGSGGVSAASKNLANMGNYEGFVYGQVGSPRQGVAAFGKNPNTGKQEILTRQGFVNSSFFDYNQNGLNYGMLPLDVNPVFGNFTKKSDNLTDLQGNPLNQKLVIPYGPEATLVNMPDGSQVLQFEAFIHEDASPTRIMGGRYIDGGDDDKLSNIIDYYEGNSDKDPRFGEVDTGFWGIPGNQEWLKSTVQIKIDPQHASSQARLNLDKNPMYSSKAGYNMSAGAANKIEYPTISK